MVLPTGFQNQFFFSAGAGMEGVRFIHILLIDISVSFQTHRFPSWPHREQGLDLTASRSPFQHQILGKSAAIFQPQTQQKI